MFSTGARAACARTTGESSSVVLNRAEAIRLAPFAIQSPCPSCWRRQSHGFPRASCRERPVRPRRRRSCRPKLSLLLREERALARLTLAVTLSRQVESAGDVTGADANADAGAEEDGEESDRVNERPRR